MDLRQLTVHEQFGWINMRAITFSFVDQSSSRGLKKFGEKLSEIAARAGFWTFLSPSQILGASPSRIFQLL